MVCKIHAGNKSSHSHNTKTQNTKRNFMFGHSKLTDDTWERSYLVAVLFEKVSGSFQRRKSSLVRKFTLQKKRELFKYKDFILAVRSHNSVRSLDLSVAAPNDILFLPPKSSLCREDTQCPFPKTTSLALMKSMEGHLT